MFEVAAGVVAAVGWAEVVLVALGTEEGAAAWVTLVAIVVFEVLVEFDVTVMVDGESDGITVLVVLRELLTS